MSIEERIKRLFAKKLGFHKEQIQRESRLESDLGFDSMDSFEAIIALEEEFDLEYIRDEEVASFTTFGEYVNLVEQKLNEKAVTSA